VFDESPNAAEEVVPSLDCFQQPPTQELDESPKKIPQALSDEWIGESQMKITSNLSNCTF